MRHILKFSILLTRLQIFENNSIGKNGGSKDNNHEHSVNPPSLSVSGGTHTHTGTTGAPSSTKGIADCNVCSDSHAASTSHTHSISVSGGSHTHTVDIGAFNSEIPTDVENRPPYYTLAYIYKL